MKVLVLLVLTTSALLAVEEDLPGPHQVRAGWAPMFPGLRDVVGRNAWHVGGGYTIWRQGLFGRMGLDVDVRGASSNTGSLLDTSAAYVERIPWQNQVYGGFGVGIWTFRIDDKRDDGDGVTLAVRPGAKAMVGYQFPVAESGVRSALEFSLIAVVPANNYTVSGLTVDLVVGF